MIFQTAEDLPVQTSLKQVHVVNSCKIALRRVGSIFFETLLDEHGLTLNQIIDSTIKRISVNDQL